MGRYLHISRRMKVLGGLILCSVLSLGWSTTIESWSMMKSKFDRYNLMSMCYGKDVLAAHNAFIFKSIKFCQANPSEHPKFDSPLTEDDWQDLSGLVDSPAMARFLPGNRRRRDASDLKEEIAEQREELMKNLGLLGCTLNKMNFLDLSKNEIEVDHLNMDMFRNYFTKAPADSAGKDEEFLQKLVYMIQDCKAISDSWPQQALDRHPFMAAHGRKKVFFECMFKSEEELCYKWQSFVALDRTMKAINGDMSDLGLLGDKFEQSKSAWLTHYTRHMDEGVRFVMDFFWSRNRS